MGVRKGHQRNPKFARLERVWRVLSGTTEAHHDWRRYVLLCDVPADTHDAGVGPELNDRAAKFAARHYRFLDDRTLLLGLEVEEVGLVNMFQPDGADCPSIGCVYALFDHGREGLWGRSVSPRD